MYPYLYNDSFRTRFVSQLGDFGLVRVGPNEVSKIIPVTENIVGTSAYMAPEAFRGDVSVKMDTFSYGVVCVKFMNHSFTTIYGFFLPQQILLELLTGLPPHKDDREGNDMVYCSIQILNYSKFTKI